MRVKRIPKAEKAVCYYCGKPITPWGVRIVEDSSGDYRDICVPCSDELSVGINRLLWKWWTPNA